MSNIELRPYQLAAIDGLRAGFRTGHKRQVLVAPCGAGKSVVAAFLMQESQSKRTPVAFVVDRRELVNQLSATLDRYRIDHGVLMAGHWRYRPSELIQVCSAQTLEKRGAFPGMKLVIADEGHSIREQYARMLRSMPDLFAIALTATPFTKGMGELYQNVVNVCTTNWLVQEGFLVHPMVYAAISPDMTGAKTVGGEWSDREVESRALPVIGDIVSEWIDKTTLHFGGPAKTIVFSATVNHGTELCRQFQEAGYRFEQISYRDMNEERRTELIAEYRKPDSDIVGLVACEIFSRGFDVPDVMVGVDARPLRKSLSGHIQKIGRIMRSAPGKDRCLWLCHAGNFLRFKEDTDKVFAHGVSSLDKADLDAKVRKEPTAAERERLKCSCGYVLPARAVRCPACGKERLRRSMVEQVPGVMELIDGERHPKVPPFLEDRAAVWRQLVGWSLERKGDPEAAKRFAMAQYRNLYGGYPAGSFEHAVPLPICSELKSKVVSNLIRWAKSKKRDGRRAA